ncbi:MAG TPA: hypothetical protein VGV15_03475, partial [Terriglobales bacterium]|nr:hypothetical protein [Terriglobales bacterium]
MTAKSMGARVFGPGVIALMCLLLSSCGGGSSHPSSSASVAVHVSPSTAIVATDTTQQFTATVIGTSNTAVNWSVNGVAGGNTAVGTISGTGLYAAPSSIPSPATVKVTATDQASPTLTGSATVTVISPPDNQRRQSLPIKLGTTGGNVKDFTISGNTITCCSGTLGALVSRAGAPLPFILSNNHVLARSDQAKIGEAISQPGLVDNNCNPGTTVANLSQAAPLKTSGVDAALAAVVSGAVDSTGAILDLGTNQDPAPPAGTLATPAVNMPVAKSGRSSGLTCSSVQTISTSVRIDYQTSCNGGTTFTVTFNNQVVVGGGGFSAAGDSGSLIVNSQTAQPVALLYGGNSTGTVGNPIQAVLTALKDPSSGAVPVIVGGAQHPVDCSATAAMQTNSVMLSQQEVQRATSVKSRHEVRLVGDPAVIGVGVGASDDNPGEAALVLYVDREKTHAPIPAEIEVVRTKVIVTDRFHATSNQQSANVSQPEEALSDAEVSRATAAKEKHAERLMSDPAILGVGVGRSADDPSQGALVIYIDKTFA